MVVVLERYEKDGIEGDWVYWGTYDTTNTNEVNALVEAAAVLGENGRKVRVREVK